MLLLALAGCVQVGGGTDQDEASTSAAAVSAATSVATPSTTASDSTSGSGSGASTDQDSRRVHLNQIGVSFHLPTNWLPVASEELVFAAGPMEGSGESNGYFSIASESAVSAPIKARSGETLTNLEIDGVEVVEIENAAIDFPSGVDPMVNELVVSDDPHGFSVIMSFEGELEPVWDDFISSIEFYEPSSDPPPAFRVHIDNPSASIDLPAGFVDVTPDDDPDTDRWLVSIEDGSNLSIGRCNQCEVEEDETGTTEPVQVDGVDMISIYRDDEALRVLITPGVGDGLVILFAGDQAADQQLWDELLSSIDFDT